MKNKVVNKHILKAISIGLAATIAMTPVTALAAEGDTDDGDGTGSSENAKKASEENQNFAATNEAVSAADSAIDTASKSTGAVAKDIHSGENAVKAGELNDYTTSTEEDLAQKVIDASNAITEVGENGQTALDTADDALDSAADNIESAAAADLAADAAVDAAGTASDTMDAAIDGEDGMNAIVEEADEALTAKIAEINNASTIAEANAAYAEAEQIVDDATADFNAKLAAYNEAKAAYEAALTQIETQQALYENMLTAAEGDLDAAKAALETAKNQADALKNAVDAAETEIKNSDAVKIASLEAEIDTNLSWTLQDDLFSTILSSYYLPKLGINNATIEKVKDNSDHQGNYFTATFVDENGNTVTKYYNYRRVDDNNNNKAIEIFEKREVEIAASKGEASFDESDYYSYVDSQGKTQKVDKAKFEELKESDSLQEIDGTYYYLNNETSTDTKVTEGTQEDGSDVSIDKDSEKVTYKLDEQGNVVKVVTADTTTVTYTDKTLTGEATYTTKAAAKTAGEAAAKAAMDGDDKDEEVTVTKAETYTATATFIPVFSTTIKVNADEWAGSASGAIKDQYNDEIDNFDSSSVNIVSTSGTKNLTANKNKDVWGDYDRYRVSGTIDVTYEKVEKEKVSLSTLNALLSSVGLSNAKEVSEDAVQAAIEAAGGILLNYSWFNWDLKTATVTYIAGQSVSATGSTKEEAESNLSAAIAAKLNELGASSSANVKKNEATLTDTKYGYTVTYKEGTSTVTEDAVISTTTYADANAVKGNVIQNYNFYGDLNGNNKNILLNTADDEDYRSYVDTAAALNEKYQALAKKAATAQSDVAKAQEAVDAIQLQIDALQAQDKTTRDADALAALQAALEQAEADKDAAQEKLDDLINRLQEAEDARDQRVAELTPAPATNDGGTTGTTTVADDGAAFVALAATPAVLGATRVVDTADEDDAAVLGANREQDGAAVLGEKRSRSTGDAGMAANAVAAMLGLIGAGALASKKKKPDEE